MGVLQQKKLAYSAPQWVLDLLTEIGVVDHIDQLHFEAVFMACSVIVFWPTGWGH